MKGLLITIEGGDGSGKATQSQRLYERLINEGYNAKEISFPNYESDSSALVKMYLNGEFGLDPYDVDPYVASTFYAVDRYASYKKEWGNFYLQGGIIIADRYTTANMIHQAAKISDAAEKDKFLNWLVDFEFNIFKLPQPDCVFFLDVPPELSIKLMQQRCNKYTGSKEKDIHERNFAYIEKTYKNACIVGDRYGWNRINCIDGDKLRSIDQIHEEIYSIISKKLLK